jgi:hypothetical protein
LRRAQSIAKTLRQAQANNKFGCDTRSQVCL